MLLLVFIAQLIIYIIIAPNIEKPFDLLWSKGFKFVTIATYSKNLRTTYNTALTTKTTSNANIQDVYPFLYTKP